jgi:hypothetical protein
MTGQALLVLHFARAVELAEAEVVRLRAENERLTRDRDA